MPSILFVCTGNICRSPLAEGLFKDLLASKGLSDHWRVSSAGTWALPGEPAAYEVQNILTRRGVDLTSHRAREVNRTLIANADLVLTMTRSQKEALQLEFPGQASRIMLISELGGMVYDIPDPYGGPSELYGEIAGELEALLEMGWKTTFANLAREG